jgi:hypothetical protein
MHTSSVVVDRGLAQHSVVLNLGFTEGRSVSGDQDDLSLAGADSSDGRSETDVGLAALHDKSQSGVDGFGILLLWGGINTCCLLGGENKKGGIYKALTTFLTTISNESKIR